jgi:hypothetical protein
LSEIEQTYFRDGIEVGLRIAVNLLRIESKEDLPGSGSECIYTPDQKTAGSVGTAGDTDQIPKNDLKEFLEILDQKATDDEDEEVPPEYYEGIFSTINDIRRKFGIPLVSH